MTYELTQHAADALADRCIPPEWMEQALASPTLVEPDRADPRLRHHLRPIAERGNRILRVVLDPTAAPVRIITVYFDRKMKGRL
jgi:hypothetical protein